MTDKLVVLECAESDLDAVGEIALESFSDYNSDDFKYMCGSTNYKFLVAKIDGNVVGFVVFLRIDEKCEIIKIATKASFRGCGVGFAIMKEVENYARSNAHNGIILEVNEHNVAAIGLYKKFGFKQIHVRNKYYENKYDALIMEYVIH